MGPGVGAIPGRGLRDLATFASFCLASCARVTVLVLPLAPAFSTASSPKQQHQLVLTGFQSLSPDLLASVSVSPDPPASVSVSDWLQAQVEQRREKQGPERTFVLSESSRRGLEQRFYGCSGEQEKKGVLGWIAWRYFSQGLPTPH